MRHFSANPFRQLKRVIMNTPAGAATEPTPVAPPEPVTGFRSAWAIIRSRGLLRQTPLFIGLAFATVLEGFGLAAFIPILLLLEPVESRSTTGIAATLHAGFENLGFGPPTISLLLGIFMVCVTAKSAVMMGCMAYTGFATADFVTDIRYRLAKKIMRAKWSFFTEQPVGLLNHAIVTEAKFAGRAYRAALRVFVRSISGLIYIALAAAVNWKVALGGIVAAVIIGLGVSRLVVATKKARREQARTTRELVGQLSELLTNLKPMKAMERAGFVRDALVREVSRMHAVLRKMVVTEQTGGEVSDLLFTIMMAIGFYVAVTVVQLRVAEIIVIGILVQRLAMSISRVNLSLVTLDQIDPMYWQLNELIERVDQAREPAFGARMPTLERELCLESVDFAYGTTPVLRDVSIRLPAGRTTVIIGQSGAGKTTIADLVLGLHLPTAGRITLDGTDLRQIDIRQWRSMIGYVPQELLLFNDTVLNNVTLGDEDLDEADAVRALALAGAIDFVTRLPDGLHTRVGERGMMLSGGQRQRIALARALVADPTLLILDEATSALDPETERGIVEAVSKLSGGSITILAITHQPAWTASADLVYRLERGAIATVDTPSR